MEKDNSTEDQVVKDQNIRNKLFKEYYPYPIPFDPNVGMPAFNDIEKAPEVADIDDDFKKANSYMGNLKLMRGGVEFQYTPEQEEEFDKCYDDIFYFIVNYVKIINLKGGLELFKLFQYQKNAIKIIAENRFSIFKFPRQMGKCVVGKTKVRVRINGTEMLLTIAQLYDLIETDNSVETYTPNYDYQILTEDGFKDFDGITTKSASSLICITLEDGSIINVTPEHEIKLFKGEFIQALNLSIGDVLGVDKENKIINISEIEGEFRVADLISVKDTQSFVVNKMSAILSNCIDGDSMITLLDNHTNEIFEIHISELYNYLLEGSK